MPGREKTRPGYTRIRGESQNDKGSKNTHINSIRTDRQLYGGYSCIRRDG